MLPPPPTSTLFPYTTLFRSPHLARLRLPDRNAHHREHDQQHGFFRGCAETCDQGDSAARPAADGRQRDRKSTRLNSSHRCISYAVFCLKKKKKTTTEHYRIR